MKLRAFLCWLLTGHSFKRITTDVHPIRTVLTCEICSRTKELEDL